MKRPQDLTGTTYKIPVGLEGGPGSMYVTINGVDGRPLEVFITIGKVGSEASIMADCVARLISCQLQDGADVDKLIRKHLVGMRGGHAVPWPVEQTIITSIPDGVGKAIKRWIHQNEVPVEEAAPEPKKP